MPPLVGDLIATNPNALDCELPSLSAGEQTRLIFALIAAGYTAPKMRKTQDCTVVVYAERKG